MPCYFYFIVSMTFHLGHIMSASCWMGTLLVWASSTSFTIWLRAVSAPTCVALIMMKPVWLMAPQIIMESFSFLTGIDFPVIKDSSHMDSPEITFPSTGTYAPGRTLSMSPLCTTSTLTTFSLISSPLSPIYTIRVSVAFNERSLAKASLVLAIAIFSSHLPRLFQCNGSKNHSTAVEISGCLCII